MTPQEIFTHPMVVPGLVVAATCYFILVHFVAGWQKRNIERRHGKPPTGEYWRREHEMWRQVEARTPYSVGLMALFYIGFYIIYPLF